MRTKLRSVYKRLHTRFGAPGVVAIIALFVAMGGTAAVAGDQLASTSKKKGGKPGPRGPAGPPGPAGPAGPAGPQGGAGTNGTNGTNGAPGADGKTVRSGTTAPEGAVTGNTGDFYIRTSNNTIFGPKTGANGTNTGWGSATSLVGSPGADGNDGAPGQDGTFSTEPLPSGETLTGVWSAQGDTSDAIGLVAPISFPIQLPGPLGCAGGTGSSTCNVHYDSEPNFGDFDGPDPAPPDPPNSTVGCEGSSSDPTAPAGHLCVYAGITNDVTPGDGAGTTIATPSGGVGADPTGAVVFFQPTGDPAVAFGVWAVTAP